VNIIVNIFVSFSDQVFASQKLEEAKHTAAMENEKENLSEEIPQLNESCS